MRKIVSCLALLMAAGLAVSGFADEAPAAAAAAAVPVPNKGDVSWMLVSTLLVLMMSVPPKKFDPAPYKGAEAVAIAKAAMNSTTAPSSKGPCWPVWKSQPTSSSARAWTAVPASSSGRRPSRSTKAMATSVKTRLISPTQTDAVNAVFVLPPAAAKIFVE